MPVKGSAAQTTAVDRLDLSDNGCRKIHGKLDDIEGRRKARQFRRQPAEGSAFRHETISVFGEHLECGTELDTFGMQ